MFTGIIRHIGKVISLKGSALGQVLTISNELFLSSCRIGDSISVNGTCLTIISLSNDLATFDIASETLRKTSLGALEVGSIVNLETSLCLGDKIDGHLVYGHVDATAEVHAITIEGETIKFAFSIADTFLPYFAPKGSVSIDGVSLTVGEVGKLGNSKMFFTVYVIPHTFQNTIFNTYEISQVVNVEIDSLARYAVNALKYSQHVNTKKEG